MIEQCTFDKLEEYRVRNKKEYFTCSYNQAIAAVAECVKFFEGIDIDTMPDITNLDRSKLNDFDPDKIVKVIFTHDGNEIGQEEENSDDSSEGSDNDDFYLQNGGADTDIEIKYLNLKLNYLQMIFELM